MLTVALAIIAGYIAIGIAVVATINYAHVDSEDGLGSVGE